MNIGYVFDEGFVQCAAVSMVSVMMNNMDADSINFYIINDGIKEVSRNKLEDMVHKYGRTIKFTDSSKVREYLQEMGVQPWRGKYSAYMKLMMSQFGFEKDINRVVILDADTIIDGSITELGEMDLGGCPCAMALEAIPGGYHKYVGLEQTELFNTGVIVCDLKCWNSENVENLFLEHLNTVSSHYMLPEEDPISIVLKNKVKTLNPKYNFVTPFFLYCTNWYFKKLGWNQLGNAFYSLQDISNAKNNIVIYHCIDTFTNRPWDKFNCHPYTPKYDFYLKETLWNLEEKQTKKLSLIEKIELILRYYLPESISKNFYLFAMRLFYSLKAKKFYS